MTDQHSTSNDSDEPPRGRSIPADFIWDPEVQGWYPPGEPCGFDVEAFSRDLREYMENRTEEERRYGLITVDQLIAAGVIVPREEKKKRPRGGQKRQLGLFDEADTAAVEEASGDVAKDDDDAE